MKPCPTCADRKSLPVLLRLAVKSAPCTNCGTCLTLTFPLSAAVYALLSLPIFAIAAIGAANLAPVGSAFFLPIMLLINALAFLLIRLSVSKIIKCPTPSSSAPPKPLPPPTPHATNHA